MYEEDYKLKHAWKKLEEKLIVQEKTPWEDRFQKSGAIELSKEKPGKMTPQGAIRMHKSIKRQKAMYPPGTDTSGFALCDEDGKAHDGSSSAFTVADESKKPIGKKIKKLHENICKFLEEIKKK